MKRKQPEVPEVLKLTQEQLLTIRLREEEMLAADCRAQLLVLQRDLFLQSIDPSGKMRALTDGIKEATSKFAQAQADLSALKAKIETDLKIKLSEYAYDDVTGVLRSP